MNAEFTELLNKALSYHKSNQINEAENIYRKLLEYNPNNVNVLNLYGLLCLSQNNIDESISLLSKAMVLNPSAYIISNLAKAYYSAGEYNKSIQLYIKAAIDEPSDDIFYSMALAYKKAGNVKECINSYEKAIALNPDNYNVLYNLANIYKETGDIDNALKYAVKAEFLNEKDVDVQTLLSTLFEAKNQYKKSIIHLEKAFSLENKFIYLYNIAVLSAKIGNQKKAISNYLKVLEFNPTHIESLVNISSLYRNIDKDVALVYIKKAYSIASDDEIVSLSLAQLYKDLYKNSDSIEVLKTLLENKKSSEAYSLLGMNYMDMQEYSEALKNYNNALSLNPSNLDYMHGKAMALKYLGRLDDALLLMEYVVNKGDKSIQSVTTLGMMYLQQKKFKQGMPLYLRRSEDTKFDELFKDKIWDGSVSFDNKKVLVYSDCGLGDTIMFARYLPILQKKSNKVILQTDKELVSILKYNYPDIDVIRKSQNCSEYDVVIPIMNLPYALDLDFDNIPNNEKYLKTDNIHKELFKNDKFKIGLFYQGNKRVFKNRSIQYSKLSDLFEITNADFYSFQIENDEFEGENVINLKKYIKDYSDTASLLKNMDVLVTIDSSIAHMAGALGVKTYLLLPNTAEWRWFNDTETTPWYKSIRIFKQNTPNNWSDVLETVKKELINDANKWWIYC